MQDLFVSPYQKTGGLVWFARMVRKLRLWRAGEIPPDYLPYVGKGFDRRCLAFLRVTLEALVERLERGGSDEEILEWCFGQGHRPSENEILVWNEYMIKHPHLLRLLRDRRGAAIVVLVWRRPAAIWHFPLEATHDGSLH